MPQGTLLSPLLFILYINDLKNISQNFSSVLYADDTTLLFRSNSFENLISTCNRELENFRLWSMANRLSLNVEKTHLFFVSNFEMPYLPQIYYGNNILEFASEVRYLGVLLDNKLKFKNHIQTICNKISKNTGIIYRL